MKILESNVFFVQHPGRFVSLFPLWWRFRTLSNLPCPRRPAFLLTDGDGIGVSAPLSTISHALLALFGDGLSVSVSRALLMVIVWR